MARQPRQFMRQGVADLPTRDAVNAYVGARGEPIFDGDTLRVMTGDKAGGVPLAPASAIVQTYSTLAAAQAARPTPDVTTIALRGRDAPGDGLGRSYKRVSAIGSGASGFSTADGAQWQRVDGGVGAIDLGVFTSGDANLFASSAPYIPGADPLFAPKMDRNGNAIQLDPKAPRQSVYWHGARNEVGVTPGPADDTAAYQSAIDAVRAAMARNIPSCVDLGTGSSNIGSPLAHGNNILFRGARHSAVNNRLPGYGDGLAMSQSYDIRQMGMDLLDNQWVDYVSAELFPTSGTTSYEKASHLTFLTHRDGSVWPSYDACSVAKDGVGHQIIVNCEADLTRAYGMHVIMLSRPGVRSFSQCLELEAHNQAGDSYSERRQGTWATRGIIGAIAANGIITNGIIFGGSDYSGLGKAGTFENIIYAQYTAIDNYLIRVGLATPTATNADDMFSIHKSGVITIGQSGIDPTGAALWIYRNPGRLNAAGNQNAVIKLQSDSGSAQNYITFVRSGAEAKSFGYNHPTGLFELTMAEGLEMGRMFSASKTAVGIGSTAPQDCGATNVFWLSQAGSIFDTSKPAPVAGAAIIFDGSALFTRLPDGNTYRLSMTKV